VRVKPEKSDDSGPGSVFSRTTILHQSDGSVAYVNQCIAPSFVANHDADIEIARLSAKYAQRARIIKAPKVAGAPHGRIAIWGDIRLTPLEPSDVAVARAGKSPGKGMLADFLCDITRSEQLGLPIYSVEGDSGFLWIAHYDDRGRGGLRFFAIDAARLSTAFQGRGIIDANPQPQQLSTTTATHLPPIQAATRDLLVKCGSSCPTDPGTGKLRMEMQDQLDRQNSEAKEADAFASAIGDHQKLSEYIGSCKLCEFRGDANAELASLQNAQSERDQYFAARATFNCSSNMWLNAASANSQATQCSK
jgi:hypothetical protein